MKPAYIDRAIADLERIVALIGFTESVEADAAAFAARHPQWADYITEQVDRIRETAPCGYDWQERLGRLQRTGEVAA